MNCKNCNTETKNKLFCSSSCSATFNNKLRPSTSKKYNCVSCNKLCNYSSNKSNLFCGSKCQQEYRFITETIPLIEQNKINSAKTLKNYLLKTRVNECEICKLGNIWNGLLLKLQLDHIDGNSDNNYPSNLRLLCPNCHSQTDTFAGKIKGKKNTKRNSYLRKFKGYEN